MTVQPLIAALNAAVEAAGVAFGDGKKPTNATTRYIVAFFDGGTVEDRSLRSRDGWSTVMTAHCYGQTPEAARFACEALTAAVLGLWGASVGDRIALMPEQLVSLPLQRDDAAATPLFDQISEWRLRTSPA